MTQLPIYTSEPMATRALAAEIRHDSKSFVELLRERTGLEQLTGIPVVRCEGAALVDVELTFETADGLIKVGIEAKFDNVLMPAQIDRQLEHMAHVVVLIPDENDVPSWVRNHHRTSGVTWAEALVCFSDSRLTDIDVASIPLQKRSVERRYEQLSLVTEPPEGWLVRIERNGAGLPAVLVKSPRFPDGRELRAQLQVADRPMPSELERLRFEYFLGISIEDERAEFPDPDSSASPPPWVQSLLNLRDVVIGDTEDEYLVNLGRPGPGRSAAGKTKIALIKKFAPESTWLAKGYRDWALGIKSEKVHLDRLDGLASMITTLATRWFEAETSRQIAIRSDAL